MDLLELLDAWCGKHFLPGATVDKMEMWPPPPPTPATPLRRAPLQICINLLLHLLQNGRKHLMCDFSPRSHHLKKSNQEEILSWLGLILTYLT